MVQINDKEKRNSVPSPDPGTGKVVRESGVVSDVPRVEQKDSFVGGLRTRHDGAGTAAPFSNKSEDARKKFHAKKVDEAFDEPGAKAGLVHSESLSARREKEVGSSAA